MKRVIIESPWRGNVERHRAYLIECIRDSVLRGESPYASHMMLTEALDDNDPASRSLGMICGYAWWKAASFIAIYTDLGWSEGMRIAKIRGQGHGMKIKERRLADYKNRDNATGQPQP